MVIIYAKKSTMFNWIETVTWDHDFNLNRKYVYGCVQQPVYISTYPPKIILVQQQK